MSQRAGGRAAYDMRLVSISQGWLDADEGSVLASFGKTTILCVVSFTGGIPYWCKDTGLDWVTTEYSMLPRVTDKRPTRESVKRKVDGRMHEILRLIGRMLRAYVDMRALSENTIQLNCDALRTDGGTRTVSITGAFAALADAVDWAVGEGIVKPHRPVLSNTVNAASVGVVDGHPVPDLPYEESSCADTDMNVVAADAGRLIKIQGIAECMPFSRGELEGLLDLVVIGTAHLAAAQREALTDENPIDPRIVAGWGGR